MSGSPFKAKLFGHCKMTACWLGEHLVTPGGRIAKLNQLCNLIDIKHRSPHKSSHKSPHKSPSKSKDRHHFSSKHSDKKRSRDDSGDRHHSKKKSRK
ncbi:hypothetical protein E2C01_059753 [Portunus trituberculatus]|uniref:Uncharacterized protein n=1 Tax=Portunus trituberculatus TaxID=210409 RepID=A0A5B7H7I8_PORTR|nr:hypothetical protein [Portunus trituberculatus]